MKIERTNRELFLEGIHQLTGISLKKLEDYSKKNDIMHIWNHPEDLNITGQQLEAIYKLKKLNHALEFLKVHEDEKKVVFNEPYKIAAYFHSQMHLHKENEHFMVAYLDSKGHLLASDIWEGTINQTIVDPRSIVKRALQLDSASIIIGHCHPSGDVTPSREDINLTKSFQRIFDALGIGFLDHIIIGDCCSLSLRDKGYMGEERGYIQKSDLNMVSISQLAMSAETMEGYERE